MTFYKSNRCKECDSLLWSNHAKECGMCSDCENVDSDVLEDLEERLENALG